MNLYKKRLLIILTFAVLSFVALFCLSNFTKSSTLETNGLSLDQHSLSGLEKSIPPAGVFLGASEVGEELSSEFSKIPGLGPIYNLAAPGGNIMTIMAYLALCEEYHPKRLLIELSPYSFNVRTQLSGIVYHRPDLIAQFVPAGSLDRLNEQTTYKSVFLLWSIGAHNFFNRFLRPAFFWIYTLRNDFFKLHEVAEESGDTYYDGSLKQSLVVYYQSQETEFIEGLQNLISQKSGDLVVYIAPKMVGKVDPNYQAEVAKLVQVLQKEHVLYFDYSDLFASSPEYFVDNYHLNAAGFKALADRFYHDLVSHLGEDVLR